MTKRAAEVKRLYDLHKGRHGWDDDRLYFQISIWLGVTPKTVRTYHRQALRSIRS